ncbi:MAG: XRE family transcriptional regulator [Alphaproteobacteria bacterium]|nr:XRE family transcriptional regulator [Alphaproteobacteria bacterium]
MKAERFNNVWDALAKSPEEAQNLTLRSDLMNSIEKAVAAWKLPQGEAAKRLGITRPRLNDLLRGKLSKFSLDALAALAMRAGLKVKLSVKKAA